MGSSPSHRLDVVGLLLACLASGGMPATAEPPAPAAATSESIAALPTTVRAAAAHTYLRAGPSDDFYPTERLAFGIPVEVWAFDESGYCAVRPVQGSYSWMRRCDVECTTASTPGGATAAPIVGVVVTDGALARVGSQLNDLRHVTQVALEAGERVTVVESVTIPDGRHAGDWVRIEPPPGEFRWARADDLALPPELSGVIQPVEPTAGVGLAAAGEALAAIRDAGSAVQQAVAEINAPMTDLAPARDQLPQPAAGLVPAPLPAQEGGGSRAAASHWREGRAGDACKGAGGEGRWTAELGRGVRLGKDMRACGEGHRAGVEDVSRHPVFTMS